MGRHVQHCVLSVDAYLAETLKSNEGQGETKEDIQEDKGKGNGNKSEGT